MPRDWKEEAAGAALGGAAGQGLYQSAGYSAKHLNRRLNDPKVYKDPKTRRGYTSTAYKKTIEGHKKKHGIKDPNQKSDWKTFQRTYPKDIPGSRTIRILSRTHGGKTGMTVGALATGVGAAAGREAKDDDVRKSAFGVIH